MADEKILYTKLDGDRRILRLDETGNMACSLDGGVTWTTITTSGNETKWK